jgi:hypothetical protein
MRWLYLRGDRHTVLGNQVKDETATRREALDFLSTLRLLGLRATDRCIDYGCRSLWAAEPVIEFLRPNSYLGLDVTNLFFDMGVQRLPPALLVAKQPKFSVIAPSSLEQARRFRPTFIFSRKTLVHVPPAELGAFLSQACALMAPETICVHEMPPTTQGSHQFNKYSWIHSPDDIRAALPKGFCVGYRENAFVVLRNQDQLPQSGGSGDQRSRGALLRVL